MPNRSIHQIGQELYTQLQRKRGGIISFAYAEFRKRFGLARRSTAKMNQCGLIIADHGVYCYPEVNGKRVNGKTHNWGEFSDRRTRVVCKLRGADDRPGRSPKAKATPEVRADAGIWVTDDNRMQVIPAKGTNPKPLHLFQQDGVAKLSEKMRARSAGVLVLPTGGGKTRTAVDWLLKNVIEKNGKVLWLAHRHELIDQACNAFCQSAYRMDNLPSRESFICHKISGRHDQPVSISSDDDVLVASVFSLGKSNGLKWLKERWLVDERPVCMVVDEAHHAPAPTYRKVIDAIRVAFPDTRLLGLTATPFRTADREGGLMKKMFPGDIVYKVDLKQLIDQGFLAKPNEISVPTGVDFGLDDKTVDLLIRSGGDFSRLGEDIARELGENGGRNRLIVDHYVENKKEYGRTLIFALNIVNAIALAKLLRTRGIRADYVVSSIHDADHHVRIDAARNKQVVERFKRKELDVLVNVNILTEGFDDPSIHTVFLARPTMSTILMMQMVGRALRGPKMGGTKTANIVSFIDDWADKIRWTSPGELLAREAEFGDTPAGHESIRRLVLITLIENYAAFLDTRLGTNVFGDLQFIKRIPVGVYSVSALDALPGAGGNRRNDDNVVDQTTDILVFEGADAAFKRMLKEVKPKSVPAHGTSTFDRFVLRIMKRYFENLSGLPFAPRERDIRMMLAHMAENRQEPPFYEFDGRGGLDAGLFAQDICDKEMGPKTRIEYLKKEWDADPQGLQTAFSGEFAKFERAVSDIVSAMTLPPGTAKPVVVDGKKPIEDCSLSELFEKHPAVWEKIRSAVYAGARDRASGKYKSAETGWMSNRSTDFQIDHIRPRSEGGKTILENLRLVCRWENARKGTRCDDGVNSTK
jgi:superfamily II DNA or RNA helicase